MAKIEGQKLKQLGERLKYKNWDKNDDIRNQLTFEIMVILDDNSYPPIHRDELYDEVIEQAKNFKKNS